MCRNFNVNKIKNIQIGWEKFCSFFPFFVLPASDALKVVYYLHDEITENKNHMKQIRYSSISKAEVKDPLMNSINENMKQFPFNAKTDDYRRFSLFSGSVNRIRSKQIQHQFNIKFNIVWNLLLNWNIYSERSSLLIVKKTEIDTE